MTNEEKAQEICEKNKQFHVECSSLECYMSALDMAQWKDEQLEHTRNDARDLYNEISACIGNLVKGRLDKNGIRESNALVQMECLMVKTEQFLLTI